MDEALLEAPGLQFYLPILGVQTIFVQVAPDAVTHKSEMADFNLPNEMADPFSLMGYFTHRMYPHLWEALLQVLMQRPKLLVY